MKVKRIVFINRAPFGNLNIDFSEKQVISLTGINGSGKTTLLSYIVDAFYEIARKAYQNEFSGEKEGKLYRISSDLYNELGTDYSMVYISFDIGGSEFYYVDLLGTINEENFNTLMSSVWTDIEASNWPVQFSSIKNQLLHGERYAKLVTIGEKDAREVFASSILTYFPSYRYEQPGYLNDVFRMELSYKVISDLTGYLPNPIEVTSDLPQLANWMMDVVLDNELYKQSEVLSRLQHLITIILSEKHKKPVRVGIGQRNMGGARIQIVDIQTNITVYPSIFNISAGEASLLCLFGELLRQADKLGKSPDDIEGIVLIDEVDKHLHIVLQKEVVPELVKTFPKVQFIISTHSTFVNIGLTDKINNGCSILDLDNAGIECEANKNDVFREAYDAITEENERYVHFYNDLAEKIKAITKPIVYLEGRTDEYYFRKAIEIFEYSDVNVDFQWIGHKDSNGNDVFAGAKNLDYGRQFIKGRKPRVLHIFLYDSDTNKQELDEDNVVVMTIPHYSNHTVMNKGIENALELDGIELNDFYDEHTKYEDYGKVVTIREFDKMKMCNHICKLDVESQKRILTNLKPIIDKIIARVEKQEQSN